MRITNKRLVKLLNSKGGIKEKYFHTCKQLERLEKARERQRELLMVLDRVSEVFEGVPLYIEEYDVGNDSRAYVSTVISSNRMGEIHRNQHHIEEELWIITLKGTRNGTGERLFTDYTDRDLCMMIVKQWVAHGILPEK